MTSIREMASCVGFSGNISVMRSFYGYTSNTIKFYGVSLLKQFAFLKNNPRIVLHIKMVNPSWPDSISKPRGRDMSIIQYIDAMRLLYESVGIGVIIKSYEVLEDMPQFRNIKIAECATFHGLQTWFGRSTSTTDEQRALFSNNNYVEILTRPSPVLEGVEQYSIELVAYFVDSTDPPKGGCAIPGSGHAIVTLSSDVYTLAHEVGHLLGLDHPEPPDPTRLMNQSPRVGSPPALVPSEVATMKSLDVMHAHC